MKYVMISFMFAFALAGCGKEQFSDPQEFADHYGREMLNEYFKSDMELMGYGDFEFTNAKVGIDRNMREYVSVVVSMKPRGKYYRHLPPQSAEDVLKVWPSDKLSYLAGTKKSMAIREMFRKVRRGEIAPVVYGTEAIDIRKMVSPWKTIRILRLKDGEGVYHPVGEFKRAIQWYDVDGDEKSEMFDIPNEPFYTGPNGLLSENAIKKFNALQEGTSDATSACSAYGERLKNLNDAIERMNAYCVTQETITAMSSIHGTTNTIPRWIQERLQEAQVSANARMNETRNKAKERTREAEVAVRNVESSLRKLNSRVRPTERAVANAKSNLERNKKQLEQLEAKAVRAKKGPGRLQSKIEDLRLQVNDVGPKSITDAEATLADLKSQISNTEGDLRKQQDALSKIVDACKSSVAELKVEMEKNQRELKVQLEREYGVVRKKSTEDLNVAINECKRLLGLTQ